MARFWFDLDGVLADFDRGCVDALGMLPGDFIQLNGERVFWKRLGDLPDFYAGLDWMAGAREMFDAIAALARDAGDTRAAVAYAQDAADLAAVAHLSIERLAAERALAGIELGGAVLPPVAATMSEGAREAAERLLTDLGLTLVRPYRVVSAGGEEARVADASADRLRLSDRDLVIDGVREAIVRKGQPVADLRRRSLLKRLLFLFAAQPGRIFSKEEIVQTVWEVEYHPLRHDAALFTNIMRIRRLLGKDGAEVLRVSEEGYRFCPGKDFLFVEPVAR
jgi:phosphoglycolate phosphatase-like HAD superfamily hydrolase